MKHCTKHYIKSWADTGFTKKQQVEMVMLGVVFVPECMSEYAVLRVGDTEFVISRQERKDYPDLYSEIMKVINK